MDERNQVASWSKEKTKDADEYCDEADRKKVFCFCFRECFPYQAVEQAQNCHCPGKPYEESNSKEKRKLPAKVQKL